MGRGRAGTEIRARRRRHAIRRGAVARIQEDESQLAGADPAGRRLRAVGVARHRALSCRQARRRHAMAERPARARRRRPLDGLGVHRSEEHTSELQSPCNLVCRLLLEKKNTLANYTTSVMYEGATYT